MALPPTELRECLRAAGAFLARRRPPPSVRAHLDYRADIKGSAVVIVALRPAYHNPALVAEHPVAKAKWVGTQQRWRLYWMRADLKWHAYEAGHPLTRIGEILDEVDRDPYGSFFG